MIINPTFFGTACSRSDSLIVDDRAMLNDEIALVVGQGRLRHASRRLTLSAF